MITKKQVRNRITPKRLHLQVEYLRQSSYRKAKLLEFKEMTIKEKQISKKENFYHRIAETPFDAKTLLN